MLPQCSARTKDKVGEAMDNVAAVVLLFTLYGSDFNAFLWCLLIAQFQITTGELNLKNHLKHFSSINPRSGSQSRL